MYFVLPVWLAAGRYALSRKEYELRLRKLLDGEIAMWNAARGFGFIRRANGMGDIFGQRIKFDRRQSEQPASLRGECRIVRGYHFAHAGVS